jgi:hypothetical protein
LPALARQWPFQIAALDFDHRAENFAVIEEQIVPDKPENSALKLLSSRNTLIMATADKNGAPNVSYAPFVHRTPRLYVYTSSRSRHTRNMMETAKASVIFIEDEARTRNLFARKRFTCQCCVELDRYSGCSGHFVLVLHRCYAAALRPTA